MRFIITSTVLNQYSDHKLALPCAIHHGCLPPATRRIAAIVVKGYAAQHTFPDHASCASP
jgi:hypothetical protein